MNFSNCLKSQKQLIFWLLFIFGLAFLIFIQYFGLIHYHYPVPPGHDAAMHYNTIQYYFNGQYNFWTSVKDSSYPPAFLVATSSLAHWFNTDSLNIMLWFTPAIIVIAAIVIFFLTKKIFGKGAALISFFLYSFATTINIQQLNDGGYPSLIAAQIILPILLLLGILIFQKNRLLIKIIYIILFLICAILLPLTHHLTTLYFFAILIFLLPSVVIYFWIKNKWSIFKGVGALVLLLIIYFGTGYLLTKISIFAAALNLFGTTFEISPAFPFIHIIGKIVPEAVIGWKTLPSYIGQSIFIFGLIGITAMPIIVAKQKKQSLLPVLVISIWTAILLIGSQMNFLSNPDRLARDAVFPLAILAGALISYSLLWSWSKNRLLFTVGLIFTLFITLIPIRHRSTNAFRYEPMVRITDADIEAINYLKQQPEKNIMIESYAFYFERFLPQKSINYLWASQTEQAKETHLLDPQNASDLKIIEMFDYIYVAEQQQGWVPSAVQIGGADKFQNNPLFQEVGHYTSITNEIYLFKILH